MLTKLLQSYKVEIDIEDLSYLNEHRKSNVLRDILQYNPPKRCSELEVMLRRCKEIGTAATKEKMIIKYGEVDGLRRWNEYRRKQSVSNTFEYKRDKYGWSIQDFENFNKSRAVTKELCIKRHGVTKGDEIWNSYKEKQAFTNSEEHLGSKRYKEVNLQKAQTIDNYIRKYGTELGTKKFQKFIDRFNSGYSNISQEFFWKIYKDEVFKNVKCYFATNEKEYGVLDENTRTYKKYDFVCPEFKLCIEFNGDHYHGNPNIYEPDDYLKGRGVSKLKAKEVWKLDEQKILLLKHKRDFDTIVIWEQDYRKDPTRTVEEIVKHVRTNFYR